MSCSAAGGFESASFNVLSLDFLRRGVVDVLLESIFFFTVLLLLVDFVRGLTLVVEVFVRKLGLAVADFVRGLGLAAVFVRALVAPDEVVLGVVGVVFFEDGFFM